MDALGGRPGDSIVDVLNKAFGTHFQSIAEAAEKLNGGGADFESTLTGILDGSIESLTTPDSCTYIRPGMFSGSYYDNLRTVIGPNVTSLGPGVFSQSKVTYASFPKLIKIPSYSITGCETMETLEVPICEEIEDSGMQGLTALKNFDASNIKTIGASACTGASSLEKIDLRSAETIGASAFSGCVKVKEVYIGPNCTSIGARAFEGIGAAYGDDIKTFLLTAHLLKGK